MAKKTEPPSDHGRALAPINPMGKNTAELFDMTHKTKHWLNPIGMSQLQRAVREKRKTAVIHGREYNLTYGEIFELSDGPRECVKVKRADGVMAPFAYVALDKILNFDFESTQD